MTDQAGRCIVIDTKPAEITCPHCGLTSEHPRNVAEGYCGHCHWWTSDPALANLHPTSAPLPLWLGWRP